MPKQRKDKDSKDLVIDFGEPTDKQMAFLNSKTLYTCFGGA